jgi:membrane protein YqaA with SNARE-associated domain
VKTHLNIVRRLYDWVLSWAHSQYGVPALFVLSFAESSFFPIPPDVLLMALSISRPKKSFYYAFVCTVASVLGGMLGYFIGMEFIDVVGYKIINFYNLQHEYAVVGKLYEQNSFWAIFTAGLTPIPYKLFTIAAGAFKIDFTVFVLASIFGRASRFFMVATLIYLFGPPIRTFIDKYFNLMVMIFTVLLIGGFVVIKYLIK